MWLGEAQRDLLDIAQGLYGHFSWAEYEKIQTMLILFCIKTIKL